MALNTRTTTYITCDKCGIEIQEKELNELNDSSQMIKWGLRGRGEDCVVSLRIYLPPDYEDTIDLCRLCRIDFLRAVVKAARKFDVDD